MASMNQSNPGAEKTPNVDPEKEKEEEERKKREADRAKRLQVRRVSPIKKFFSSIRVKFLSVIIFFTLLAAVAISVTASYMILDFYESMDTLDMKERAQNAVIGIQRCGHSIISKGLTAADAAFSALDNDNSLHTDLERGEQEMARNVFENFIEDGGRINYQNVPIQLLMVFDPDWNERLVYYRPCDDEKSVDHCEFIPREKIFVDYENGDYRMAHKIDVPVYFRTIKDHNPSYKCNDDLCLGIAADIPQEEGGPMLYMVGTPTVANISSGLYCPEECQPWSAEPSHPGWHYLVAYNMRVLQQILANRTGLCVSGFSSTESDLPDFVEQEFKLKQENGLVLDPHEYDLDMVTIKQDTDQVTLDQEYYSVRNNKYKKTLTGREYCDPGFSHGGDETVSNTYAFFAYYGFDISTTALTKDKMYIIRFTYHDPLTAEMYPKVQIFIACLIIVWLLSIAGIIVYFNQMFLVPLDRMRKLRADFIKTILQGLDDDGVLAQEVFGDMLDDSALIEANGDEISVMLTLQDRVDALYSKVIANRQSDLNRVRNHILRDCNALRLMRFFLRREEDNLRSILPGLLDSNEMARRFRRTNISDAADTEMAHEVMNARNTFRSLKSILSSNIATEFFKMYCAQRGRSTMNSFFFLMDVSWLTQVEGAARSENQDFLSSLFTESTPQSPAAGLTSPRPGVEDGFSSSELLFSPTQSVNDLTSPTSPVTPGGGRRSHFAKKTKEPAKAKPVAPAPAPAEKTDEDANKGGKKNRPPPLAIGHDLQVNSSSSLTSPRSNPLGSPRGIQRVQFLTKNGETIARFIHELYFGRKSLARTDPKHSALLGCSQVPDYMTLRDKSTVNYSPVMYNSLVAAITKKFSSDVIPQFLNSTTFQLMVHALTLSGYFEKAEKANANNARQILLLIQQPDQQEAAKEDVSGVGFNDPVIHSLISVSKVASKKKNKDDDDSSSSSSSDDDDDDDDDDDEDEKDEDEKDEDEKDDKEKDSDNK